MRAILGHALRSIGAGTLVVLPIVLTVVIVSWSADLLQQFTGPHSTIGWMLSAVGLVVVGDELVAYLIGALVVLIILYILGRLVTSSLSGQVNALLDRTIGRVPLLGSIYSLTNRFMGLLDRREGAGLQAMSPVWCFFGGDGAAVLALMPTAEPIEIEGRQYCVVLIPTAPIPFGGGLIFVPTEWVRPAGFGVERLTNIYLSMGVTAPPPPRPQT